MGEDKWEAVMLLDSFLWRGCYWDYFQQSNHWKQPKCKDSIGREVTLPNLQLNTNFVSSCYHFLMATCFMLATERMAIISLRQISLLVLALTLWHPKRLNLPIAERYCSIVLPMTGTVCSLSYLVIWNFWEQINLHYLGMPSEIKTRLCGKNSYTRFCYIPKKKII